MARVEVNRGEEPMTPSFDKEIRDATTDSRISRRNSSSTTGSGKPIPPGHWTLPISGNCPRCRHHHHSIKVHIKNTEEASGLVDVHCEKCNKLWIGPGTLNATRISLASNETIDPPPEDPEVRTALYRAIRSVTRVAILSPTLPGIQEGTPGLTRELSTRSLMQHGDQEPVGSQYPLTSSRAATSPAASSPKRIEKSKRIGTTATFSRHLLRVKSRVSRMTKYLREGSLVTSSDNRELSQNATTNSESWSMGVGPASLRSHVEHPATDTRPAAALEAQSPLCTIDPEAIGRMTPEQRFVYFRSRITAFSKQYSAIPKTSPQGSDHSYPGSVSLDMATIRDHLAGIGHGYDQRLPNDYLRNSDPALPRQSLQISDTRTSEADTVVGEQRQEPIDLLREALHRVWRSSVESGVYQDHYNSADRAGEHNRG